MKKTLHFTVQDDFLTDHARTLWSEGEFRRAMDFLGTTGISVVQAHRVIMGHLKFKEYGKTQTFMLVKDNWKPNLDRCHFSQYPDPSNGMEMEMAEKVLADDKAEKEFSTRLTKMLDDAGDNAEALRRIQTIAMTHQLQKQYPMLQDSRYAETAQIVRDIEPEISDTALDEFIMDTRINDTVEDDIENGRKPLPSPIYENGIILPNGEFYRCGALGHIRLCMSLGFGKDEGGDPEGKEPDEIALREGCVLVAASPRLKRIRRKSVNELQYGTLKEWNVFVSYLNSPLVELSE